MSNLIILYIVVWGQLVPFPMADAEECHEALRTVAAPAACAGLNLMDRAGEHWSKFVAFEAQP